LFLTVGYARNDVWKQHAMPKEIVEQLQLTPTQTVQMQAQHDTEQQAMVEKFTEIKKLHAALDKEFTRDTPDEVQITTIVQAIKKTQMDLTTIHFDGLLQIRQILTPLQFKKMIKLRQELRDKLEKKWGERIKRAMGSGLNNQDLPPPPPEGGPGL
jgi:Spy/CpxP family protein refolding chaperone